MVTSDVVSFILLILLMDLRIELLGTVPVHAVDWSLEPALLELSCWLLKGLFELDQ